jgi:peptidoglycan hydrolase CwlO-like protein
MGLFTLKINGVRYTHAQARLYIQRLEEEYNGINNELDARLKQVADLSGQIAIHQMEGNKKQKEIDNLRKQVTLLQEQLADFPARGKDGRFRKKL